MSYSKITNTNQEQTVQFTEENFPKLGNPVLKVNSFTKNFAALAVGLAEKAKKEDEEKQMKKIEVEEQRKFHRTNMPLPEFNNVHRFVEPEETEEDQPKRPTPREEADEEGWITVQNKKARRKKTIEERLNESDDDDNKEPDNSVWNNDEVGDEDTCWVNKN